MAHWLLHVITLSPFLSGIGLETLEEEKESEVGEGDPLSDLADRYEQEKEALLRILAGQGAR